MCEGWVAVHAVIVELQGFLCVGVSGKEAHRLSTLLSLIKCGRCIFHEWRAQKNYLRYVCSVLDGWYIITGDVGWEKAKQNKTIECPVVEYEARQDIRQNSERTQWERKQRFTDIINVLFHLSCVLVIFRNRLNAVWSEADQQCYSHLSRCSLGSCDFSCFFFFFVVFSISFSLLLRLEHYYRSAYMKREKALGYKWEVLSDQTKLTVGSCQSLLIYYSRVKYSPWKRRRWNISLIFSHVFFSRI